MGREFITCSSYKQMIGRAGRAGLIDSAGESILIFQPGDKKRVRELLTGGMKRCESSFECADSKAIRMLILSLIGLQLTHLGSQMLLFFNETLFFMQNKKKLLKSITTTTTTTTSTTNVRRAQVGCCGDDDDDDDDQRILDELLAAEHTKQQKNNNSNTTTTPTETTTTTKSTRKSDDPNALVPSEFALISDALLYLYKKKLITVSKVANTSGELVAATPQDLQPLQALCDADDADASESSEITSTNSNTNISSSSNNSSSSSSSSGKQADEERQRRKKQTAAEAMRRFYFCQFEITKLGMAAIKGNIDLDYVHQLHADLTIGLKSIVLSNSLHLLYLCTPYELVHSLVTVDYDTYVHKVIYFICDVVVVFVVVFLSFSSPIYLSLSRQIILLYILSCLFSIAITTTTTTKYCNLREDEIKCAMIIGIREDYLHKKRFSNKTNVCIY